MQTSRIKLFRELSQFISKSFAKKLEYMYEQI